MESSIGTMDIFDYFTVCPKCDRQYKLSRTGCYNDYPLFNSVPILCFYRGMSHAKNELYYSFSVSGEYQVSCFQKQNASHIITSTHRLILSVSGLLSPKTTANDIKKMLLLL